ncbi:MAG: DUF3617 family protein [Betaproteobacteria bacterium]
MTSPSRSTRRLLALAALAVGLATTGAASAQGKDDLWDVTTKMSMPGMPMAIPAQSNRVCVGKDRGDDQYVPKQDDCRVLESKRTGNKYSFRMDCAGKDPSLIDGEITFASNAYDGKMHMVMKKSKETMDMTFSGKRVGDCTDTSKQQVAAAKAQAEKGMAEACRGGIERLQWQLFFGDAKTAVCAGQQKDFCARATKVAQDMREPAHYRAGKQISADLSTSFSKCGQDLAAVTDAACKRAVSTRGWAFVGGGDCDADVRTQGPLHCVGGPGRSPDPEFYPLCSRLATISRGIGAAGTGAMTGAAKAGGAGSATGTVPTPAPAPAPAVQDPVKQGVDALKKLLPF